MKFNYNILLTVILFLYGNQYCYSDSFQYSYTSSGFKYVIHYHSESSYQHAWCFKHNGTEEFENIDKTRIDCLTDTHAIEFDFANKWAESIGQALHYSRMSGKKAKVVLILENPKKQMVYFKRVQHLGEIYNFDVEYVTSEILNIKNEKCQYTDCKCHKKVRINYFKRIKYLFLNFKATNLKFVEKK